MSKYFYVLVLLFVVPNSVSANSFTSAQTKWAQCSWYVYEEHGMNDLQERIVFKKEKEGDIAKWKNIKKKKVIPVCGDDKVLFSNDESLEYETLKYTHRRAMPADR